MSPAARSNHPNHPPIPQKGSPMNDLTGASSRRLARIAGVLYLINILGGAFALGVVPALLLVADPAATAQNIQTHELLYRSALVAHVLVVLTNVPLAMIFYELFKVVNRRLALLDAFFILVATSIEASGLINQFTPLILLGSGSYSNALPAAQLQALAALPSDLAGVDYSVHTLFFAVDIAIMGYLILRSTFVPRAIGALLLIDAAAYAVYGFADLLVPAFAAQLVPWIQLPALLSEGALCLWLLVVGVRTDRWMERSRASLALHAAAPIDALV
jgi:hypothetical protein